MSIATDEKLGERGLMHHMRLMQIKICSLRNSNFKILNKAYLLRNFSNIDHLKTGPFEWETAY